MSAECENTNWRARRLNACRAVAELNDVIENLNAQDSQYPVPDGHTVVDQRDIAELQNLNALLLRMVLRANDSAILSPSRLQRF